MKEKYDFKAAKRGAVVESTGKTRITIFLDDDVLEAFRQRAASEGKGYQTLINDTLRQAITPGAAPVTVDALRRVLREELHAA
ncbi:MAG: BrnA antitoxin family protein [Rhodocyclaceae bacterium]|nr:BrnA antitoxin family protein [Rhodocyclaceae bacterium]MDZ4214890.1 BrnA antitoxin family protein [Rhodocyclaceae bacterium]